MATASAGVSAPSGRTRGTTTRLVKIEAFVAVWVCGSKCSSAYTGPANGSSRKPPWRGGTRICVVSPVTGWVRPGRQLNRLIGPNART